MITGEAEGLEMQMFGAGGCAEEVLDWEVGSRALHAHIALEPQ